MGTEKDKDLLRARIMTFSLFYFRRAYGVTKKHIARD